MQAKISYLLSDYQRTLAIVLPKAEAGEPWAQYTLGYMYYYGRGVSQNRQTAKHWIESAAAKGYAPAQQAMQRLAVPPPLTEQQNTSAAEQGQAGNQATPPPHGEQLEQGPAQVPALPGPTSEPTTSTMPEPTPDKAGQSLESSPPAPQPLQPQTSTPSPDVEATAPSQPAALPDNKIKGRDWITRQDPRHYTLQLASSLDEAAIIRLIHKQGIERQAAYYSTIQSGQKWYSLLYGDFASHSAAYKAMRRLPRALRRDSPRIRSFREIHTQLSPRP
jgi:septal ring-binding cell division protein DamX